jgi:xanthine/uracil/vitamin C permease (AzgA family)
MWLGIFVGGIITVLLMMYRVRGAIIIGMQVCLTSFEQAVEQYMNRHSPRLHHFLAPQFIRDTLPPHRRRRQFFQFL